MAAEIPSNRSGFGFSQSSEVAQFQNLARSRIELPGHLREVRDPQDFHYQGVLDLDDSIGFYETFGQ